VLDSLSRELDAEHRKLLGATLVAMFNHYESPERAHGFNSELRALQSAMPYLAILPEPHAPPTPIATG
jgi:hypothetical protein